ncbi:MAG: hypothetical protein ACOH2N_12525 [Devosia sp.]
MRWQTALQVSNNQDEEDRAANVWLAGNNAAVNQNDLGLHGGRLAARRLKIKHKEKGDPEGPPNRFGGDRDYLMRNCW